MKIVNTLFTAVLLLTFCQTTNAQTVIDIVTGLNPPSGLSIYGNILYIGQEDSKTISKVNLSNSSPSVEDVLVLGEGNPFIFANDGTYLYYSNFDAGTISRIEMGIANPAPELVMDNLIQPSAILIEGNTMYFGHNLDRISKIDLTDPSPIIVDVIAGLSFPTNLALSGNDLFIAEFNGNKISKVDITESTPSLVDVLTGLGRPGQFALNGNDLYFGDFTNGNISKIDITSPNPIAEVLATDLDKPTGMAFSGSTLYFAQLGAGKISKLETVVSSTYVLNDNSISVHPNPVSDYLIINNPAKQEVAYIINQHGQVIKKMQAPSQIKIDVKDINAGIYYLRLESGPVLKFIKSGN